MNVRCPGGHDCMAWRLAFFSTRHVWLGDKSDRQDWMGSPSPQPARLNHPALSPGFEMRFIAGLLIIEKS